MTWWATQGMRGAVAVAVSIAIGGALVPSTGRAQDRLQPPPGTFVDGQGELLPFAPTYELTFSRGRDSRDPLYGWAALEMAGILAVGAVGYWQKNAGDDFPDMVERLKPDLDENDYLINFAGHPGAGASYWVFSRAAGLDVPMAFVYGVASSTVWEYAVELSANVSFNDMILTPFSGIAVGELFFQLGRYLNSAPGGGGPGQRAGQWSFGVVNAAHDAIYDLPGLPDAPPDNLGFSSAYWHRFRVGYYLGRLRNDRDASDVAHGPSLDIRLAAMPGYLKPGRFSTAFAEGNFTEGHLQLLFDEHGLAEADVRIDAIVAGYYAQDLRLEHGTLWGRSLVVGMHSGYRYVDRDLLDRPDRYAMVHLPGPGVEVRRAWRSVWLGLRAHVNGDFGGFRPVALSSFVRRNGSDQIRELLRRRDYVHGAGASGRVEVTLESHGCELGADLFYGWYASIENPNGDADEGRTVPSRDQVLEPRGWLGCAVPQALLQLRLQASAIRRWGEMGDVTETRWDRRLGGTLGIQF
ncbi:MAG: DUF3943 domain-containing protein [Myxococcota bacterium]